MVPIFDVACSDRFALANMNAAKVEFSCFMRQTAGKNVSKKMTIKTHNEEQHLKRMSLIQSELESWTQWEIGIQVEQSLFDL